MSKGLTIDSPTKFETAIASANVIPGDTILLRAGTYTGDWLLNIGGTAGLPITIKPYNGEAVVIDGSVTFGKPYLKLMDVEITDNNPDRTEITQSITMNYAGNELIGCHIHDLHNSGVNWFGSGVGRIAECLIENNGYMVGEEGHGHAIYTHNHLGGARAVERNLFRSQLGEYSIHIYSAGNNYLKDYTVKDNVIDNHPVHTGGGFGLLDFLYEGNIQYGDFSQHGRYGEAERGIIRNNIHFSMGSYYVNPEWIDLTETGNLVYGGEPSARDGYVYDDYPVSFSQLIPFSLSERWSGIQVSIVDGVFSAEMVAV